tara:strand:+ start:4456 stop:4992 length:537 start_codon:yes stop_codon:yes gene_type:complete
MNKEEAVIAQKILGGISTKKGVLWEKIAEFQSQLEEVEGVLTHKAGEVQSKGLKKIAPLKHNFEGGLYTRTMYMPKGSIIVSMIHRQQHPSFLLKGELSYLTDEGEVKRIKAPHTVFTQEGTQRVFYVHQESVWTCVYKTDATTVEEAELEIYADKYMELPIEVINKNKKICQEQQQY